MKFQLTTDEKRAILRGESKALRRETKPAITGGQTIVLKWSRGGKQFIEREERERKKAAAERRAVTIEVPRKPLFWITVSEPRQKDSTWLIEFEAHDHREPSMVLAPPPAPSSQPGLKTRARKAQKKAAGRTWTTEAERGYGAGRAAVDDVSGVDFEVLDDYSRRLAEENELRQGKNKVVGHLMAEEMRLARLRGRRRPSKPEAISAIKRRIERRKKALENPSDQAA